MLFYASKRALRLGLSMAQRAHSHNRFSSLSFLVYIWLRTDVPRSRCTRGWLTGWPMWGVICKNVTLPIRQGFLFGVVLRKAETGVEAEGRIWCDISLNPSCNVYLEHVYLRICICIWDLCLTTCGIERNRIRSSSSAYSILLFFCGWCWHFTKFQEGNIHYHVNMSKD